MNEYSQKSALQLGKELFLGSNSKVMNLDIKQLQAQKKVEKVNNETKIILTTWETIAKAAEDEKMLRSVKNKTIFNDDYYYRCLSSN